ncbi:hypothetical protein HK102_007513 [Quaeritorhiza haematococci]|nr:hypothetical protein HK102_007513 [Quaeritorhiza haematococci]
MEPPEKPETKGGGRSRDSTSSRSTPSSNVAKVGLKAVQAKSVSSSPEEHTLFSSSRSTMNETETKSTTDKRPRPVRSVSSKTRSVTKSSTGLASVSRTQELSSTKTPPSSQKKETVNNYTRPPWSTSTKISVSATSLSDSPSVFRTPGSFSTVATPSSDHANVGLATVNVRSVNSSPEEHTLFCKTPSTRTRRSQTEMSTNRRPQPVRSTSKKTPSVAISSSSSPSVYMTPGTIPVVSPSSLSSSSPASIQTNPDSLSSNGTVITITAGTRSRSTKHQARNPGQVLVNLASEVNQRVSKGKKMLVGLLKQDSSQAQRLPSHFTEDEVELDNNTESLGTRGSAVEACQASESIVPRDIITTGPCPDPGLSATATMVEVPEIELPTNRAKQTRSKGKEVDNNNAEEDKQIHQVGAQTVNVEENSASSWNSTDKDVQSLHMIAENVSLDETSTPSSELLTTPSSPRDFESTPFSTEPRDQVEMSSDGKVDREEAVAGVDGMIAAFTIDNSIVDERSSTLASAVVDSGSSPCARFDNFDNGCKLDASAVETQGEDRCDGEGTSTMERNGGSVSDDGGELVQGGARRLLFLEPVKRVVTSLEPPQSTIGLPVENYSEESVPLVGHSGMTNEHSMMLPSSEECLAINALLGMCDIEIFSAVKPDRVPSDTEQSITDELIPGLEAQGTDPPMHMLDVVGVTENSDCALDCAAGILETNPTSDGLAPKPDMKPDTSRPRMPSVAIQEHGLTGVSPYGVEFDYGHVETPSTSTTSTPVPPSLPLLAPANIRPHALPSTSISTDSPNTERVDDYIPDEINAITADFARRVRGIKLLVDDKEREQTEQVASLKNILSLKDAEIVCNNRKIAELSAENRTLVTQKEVVSKAHATLEEKNKCWKERFVALEKEEQETKRSEDKYRKQCEEKEEELIAMKKTLELQREYGKLAQAQALAVSQMKSQLQTDMSAAGNVLPIAPAAEGAVPPPSPVHEVISEQTASSEGVAMGQKTAWRCGACGAMGSQCKIVKAEIGTQIDAVEPAEPTIKNSSTQVEVEVVETGTETEAVETLSSSTQVEAVVLITLGTQAATPMVTTGTEMDAVESTSVSVQVSARCVNFGTQIEEDICGTMRRPNSAVMAALTSVREGDAEVQCEGTQTLIETFCVETQASTEVASFAVQVGTTLAIQDSGCQAVAHADTVETQTLPPPENSAAAVQVEAVTVSTEIQHELEVTRAAVQTSVSVADVEAQAMPEAEGVEGVETQVCPDMCAFETQVQVDTVSSSARSERVGAQESEIQTENAAVVDGAIQTQIDPVYVITMGSKAISEANVAWTQDVVVEVSTIAIQNVIDRSDLTPTVVVTETIIHSGVDGEDIDSVGNPVVPELKAVVADAHPALGTEEVKVRDFEVQKEVGAVIDTEAQTRFDADKVVGIQSKATSKANVGLTQDVVEFSTIAVQNVVERSDLTPTVVVTETIIHSGVDGQDVDSVGNPVVPELKAVVADAHPAFGTEEVRVPTVIVVKEDVPTQADVSSACPRNLFPPPPGENAESVKEGRERDAEGGSETGTGVVENALVVVPPSKGHTGTQCSTVDASDSLSSSMSAPANVATETKDAAEEALEDECPPIIVDGQYPSVPLSAINVSSISREEGETAGKSLAHEPDDVTATVALSHSEGQVSAAASLIPASRLKSGNDVVFKPMHDSSVQTPTASASTTDTPPGAVAGTSCSLSFEFTRTPLSFPLPRAVKMQTVATEAVGDLASSDTTEPNEGGWQVYQIMPHRNLGDYYFFEDGDDADEEDVSALEEAGTWRLIRTTLVSLALLFVVILLCAIPFVSVSGGTMVTSTCIGNDGQRHSHRYYSHGIGFDDSGWLIVNGDIWEKLFDEENGVDCDIVIDGVDGLALRRPPAGFDELLWG